ncbi:MAG TPA: hypothetical protein VLI68_08650 [Hanamia sp.]|jgi:hypothetical protein|nr:hypothetical protein [Hanamia sp.]
MKNKKLFLALGIFSIVFAACDKTPETPQLTPKEKALTGHIWKLQSLTVPKSTDPSTDSSIKKTCSDSALLAFNMSHLFQLADASKGGCDTSVVPYDKGNWAFSAGTDSVILTGKRNFVWKIVTLNDTLFKATFRDSISPERNSVKTIILK